VATSCDQVAVKRLAEGIHLAFVVAPARGEPPRCRPLTTACARTRRRKLRVLPAIRSRERGRIRTYQKSPRRTTGREVDTFRERFYGYLVGKDVAHEKLPASVQAFETFKKRGPDSRCPLRDAHRARLEHRAMGAHRPAHVVDASSV